jgi:hypothetical protein
VAALALFSRLLPVGMVVEVKLVPLLVVVLLVGLVVLVVVVVLVVLVVLVPLLRNSDLAHWLGVMDHHDPTLWREPNHHHSKPEPNWLHWSKKCHLRPDNSEEVVVKGAAVTLVEVQTVHLNMDKKLVRVVEGNDMVTCVESTHHTLVQDMMGASNRRRRQSRRLVLDNPRLRSIFQLLPHSIPVNPIHVLFVDLVGLNHRLVCLQRRLVCHSRTHHGDSQNRLFILAS